MSLSGWSRMGGSGSAIASSSPPAHRPSVPTLPPAAPTPAASPAPPTGSPHPGAISEHRKEQPLTQQHWDPREQLSSSKVSAHRDPWWLCRSRPCCCRTGGSGSNFRPLRPPSPSRAHCRLRCHIRRSKEHWRTADDRTATAATTRVAPPSRDDGKENTYRGYGYGTIEPYSTLGTAGRRRCA